MTECLPRKYQVKLTIECEMELEAPDEAEAEAKSLRQNLWLGKTDKDVQASWWPSEVISVKEVS